MTTPFLCKKKTFNASKKSTYIIFHKAYRI